MKTEDEIQSSLFKFMLAIHFAAFCSSNVNRENLLQHVIAVILAFVVKDHNGTWACLIESLLACTISVFSFTVVLYAYRKFLLCVFIDLYKFYCILTFKVFCHRKIFMLRYSILFFIFSIMVMAFVILLTCYVRFIWPFGTWHYWRSFW